MNSHIQMPKCVLKQFAIQSGANEGKVFYYNLEKNLIGLRAPKRLNVKQGHYSDVVENILSKEIETPLGKVIKDLNESLLNGKGFKLTQKRVDSIFNYLYSLLARSPQMREGVESELLFKGFYTEQNINDISVVESIELMRQDQALKNFYPTFVVNKTETPFVLPTCGYYDFKTEDEDGIVQMPLTEKICVWLFQTKYLDKYLKDDSLLLIGINNNDIIYKMNELAFITQKRYSNAYLVSSNKEEFERIKKVRPNER